TKSAVRAGTGWKAAVQHPCVRVRPAAAAVVAHPYVRGPPAAAFPAEFQGAVTRQISGRPGPAVSLGTCLSSAAMLSARIAVARQWSSLACTGRIAASVDARARRLVNGEGLAMLSGKS